MVIFVIFYDEPGGPLEYHKPSENISQLGTSIGLPVQKIEKKENEQITDGFVKLNRMSWYLIHKLKFESPWHIGWLSDDFMIHQVAQTYTDSCDSCSHDDPI